MAISVAVYVKKQKYFSHRSRDRYVVEDNNWRGFDRYIKIIATEHYSIAMRIFVLRLETELTTEISFLYVSEVTKFLFIINCNKYIIYLNIFYTRKYWN